MENTAEEQRHTEINSDWLLAGGGNRSSSFIQADEEQICIFFFFINFICKLEKEHLHTLPPSAAPHWRTGWTAATPPTARRSSPSAACVRTRPTSSLFHPRCGAVGWLPRRSPSWTAEPPTGWRCSSPPAPGRAPLCLGPPLLLSDWTAGGRTRRERETAPRSRTCAGWEGRRTEVPRERRSDGTAGDVTAA